MTSKPSLSAHLAVAAVALALNVAGCRTPSSPLPSESSTAVDRPYVIGIPDLLRVNVWKHPDLGVEAPVRRDGKISVPLLEDVQAAGHTPQELSKLITENLSKFVSRPNVTVIVISPDSQVVTVVGGVNAAGAVPIHRDMGVLEVVAAAGGFSAWANKGDVRVVRRVQGRRVAYRFDYHAFMSGKPNSDILLMPGDVVVVPE
jgi:polysaccharide export outer membrane protein